MMTEMLDLSGKNILNTAMIKMFHEQLQTHLKYMKKKKRRSEQRNRRYKEEHYGNFRTEKYND